MFRGNEKTPPEGHIQLIFLLVLSICINSMPFLYEHSKKLAYFEKYEFVVSRQETVNRDSFNS